ncbi:hypothetical protein PUN28_011455 [Cardiocondyla obscurior]|uniref:Uncharacterized protein n=1 Tax=Cardiocondyla obscurior TaxID=286306 RepID=A0AAW2FIE0_9HYME
MTKFRSSMSMASSPSSIFPPYLSEFSLRPHPMHHRDRSCPARFQDYDENLTSAKVVSVRRISHFSGTRFSASPAHRNSHGRMASKIAFPPPMSRAISQRRIYTRIK